jgi:hypothetical protein
MPKVIIEDSLNNQDQSFFNKEFSKNKSQFKLSKSLINFVNNIENKGDRQIIYFVIYKIITENKITPSINPIPQRGLSFNDNNTGLLSIYHCHLFGDMVLIWYVTKDVNDNLHLEIEYIKHPIKYDDILKNIYKNTDGWNTITNQYFKDYRNSTYLKDNFIQRWSNFIQKLELI